jgi:two-component system response regulator FixJ
MSRATVVAVVDDDPGIRESMTYFLETEGYTVAAYASAFEFLADASLGASCLIVDQQMPGMTGVELVRHLRAASNTIPAILITASPSPAVRDLAGKLGVAVFEKPGTRGEILGFIEANAD